MSDADLTNFEFYILHVKARNTKTEGRPDIIFSGYPQDFPGLIALGYARPYLDEFSMRLTPAGETYVKLLSELNTLEELQRLADKYFDQAMKELGR